MQTLPPSGGCSPQPRLRKTSVSVLATFTEQTSDVALKPSEGRFQARFEVTFPNVGEGGVCEPATPAPAEAFRSRKGAEPDVSQGRRSTLITGEEEPQR